MISVCVTATLLLAGVIQSDAVVQAPAPAGVANTAAVSTDASSAGAERSSLVHGVIRELPAGGRTIVVHHDAIPGWMPSMTMEFRVRQTNELHGLAPGDTIRFRLRATEHESWIEDVVKTGRSDASALALAAPQPAAASSSAPLTRGDLLPDAEFTSETGRPIRLSDFKGRAVALTFLFTRCPLPEYCPRLNVNFFRARERLLRAGGPTNWQFLSISFDPDFDRPEVLARYAHAVRGGEAQGWLFAAAPPETLSELGPLLDFHFATQGGSFVHNLRTVVLDPKGRIFRIFTGNTWKADELAAALNSAGQQTTEITPSQAAADPD